MDVRTIEMKHRRWGSGSEHVVRLACCGIWSQRGQGRRFSRGEIWLWLIAKESFAEDNIGVRSCWICAYKHLRESEANKVQSL